MNDWRDAAEGIPVWVGAAVNATWWNDDGECYEWEPDGAPRCVAAFMSPDSIEAVLPDGERLNLPRGKPGTKVIVNLADPDTHAAYMRRLAVALGAPPKVAARGVTSWRTDSLLHIDAGRDVLGMPEWRGIANVGTARGVLRAHALAWPTARRER